MKLSLHTLFKFISFSFILLTVGYHIAYFYLNFTFNRLTSNLKETQTHHVYSSIDLNNHYYIEAQPPEYGTLTGQLIITSMSGNYKLIIWRKFPKETTLTFQVFSDRHDKLSSQFLEIKNNSIDLEFSNFPLNAQTRIKDMEREAKEVFGDSILKDTL